MKVLIVDTYYGDFLSDFYRKHALTELGYTAQRARLFEAQLGTADYYSRHLVALGVEAEELIVNCVPLQLQWARENGVGRWRHVPPFLWRSARVVQAISASGALAAIAAEQIRRASPDVLYLQDLAFFPPRLLSALKPYVRLIVGQCGSAPPPRDYLAPFDLMLTSFPHFVAKFEALGIPARYFRLGFEPSVLAKVGEQTRRYACTFVGGFSPAHTSNLSFLEHLAENTEVRFFGYGASSLRADSPIRTRHHGEAWALEMYRILGQSQITVNRHGAIAASYANNMRLYEATGMGAMLLTDAKSNLGEMFSIGTEVVTYDSAESAVELIRYYTEHPDERDEIARAGQRRTLHDHCYARRMEELREILETRVRARA